MVRPSTRKKMQKDGPTGDATTSQLSSQVRETLMVTAEESENVPGWTYIPDKAHLDSNSRPVRVYADGNLVDSCSPLAIWRYPTSNQFDFHGLCVGIFDLFHFGHARALEQAKKL